MNQLRRLRLGCLSLPTEIYRNESGICFKTLRMRDDDSITDHNIKVEKVLEFNR